MTTQHPEATSTGSVGLPHVVLSCSGARFAVPARDVREILHLAELVRPPGCPAVVEGYLSLGDEVVPALALDTVLGVEPFPRGLYTPMVVIEGAEDALHVLVAEQADRVVSVPREAIQPVEEGSTFNDAVLGFLPTTEGPIGILDVRRLLLARERAAVEEFRAVARDRLKALDATEAPA